MSAALPLSLDWEASASNAVWQIEQKRGLKKLPAQQETDPQRVSTPPANLAFYRKHTESLLRRYLYASMQVGRAPSILNNPVARGWASSRPIRSFEDAIIFVIDVENCLSRLGSLDRELLSRVVLQEYTQAETAPLLGMSTHSVSVKLQLALDRLTEKLLEASLLVLPH